MFLKHGKFIIKITILLEKLHFSELKSLKRRCNKPFNLPRDVPTLPYVSKCVSWTEAETCLWGCLPWDPVLYARGVPGPTSWAVWPSALPPPPWWGGAGWRGCRRWVACWPRADTLRHPGHPANRVLSTSHGSPWDKMMVFLQCKIK